MGANLVTQVLMRWTHLNDRAFRLLVRMAHTALDKPNGVIPAKTYFGGRDLLAMTLRAERGGNPESVYRAVKRGIADLIDGGAIERTSAARSGNNGVYLLTLDSAHGIDRGHADNHSPDPGQGDTGGTPQGDTQGTAEGDTSGSGRGTPAVPPICKEEPLEELWEEGDGDLRTDGAVARTRDAAKESISPPVDETPKCAKPGCAKGWVIIDGAFAKCPDCATERPNLRMIKGGAA
jgi:hypothetical protein